MAADDYRLVVVDRSGHPVGDLDNAEITRVGWVLNSHGQLDFAIHPNDAKASLSQLLTNEIQLWRRGQCLWWGLPVRRRSNRQRMEVSCYSLLWLLRRLYFGKASRRNFLVNGGFETGDLTGWSATGVTATVVASHHFDGSYGLNLDQATAGTDTFVRQVIATNASTYWTAAAWFHRRSDAPGNWQSGAAYADRGLFLILIYPGNQVQATANAPLDTTTALPVSGRISTGIMVPPNAPAGSLIEVRLYAPGGKTIWDAASMTTMESLSYAHADQATIAAGAVAHAQDPAYNKVNLNIGTVCPATGVFRDQAWQFADHQNIGTELETFAKLDSGFDFDIDMVRAFRTYYPRKGTRRGELGLAIGRNIDDYNVDEDGEQTANSIVVLGDGSGPDREEAGLTASTLNGIVLEKIVTSPTHTPIDQLGSRATEELRLSQNPVVIPQPVVVEDAAPLIGVLGTGDVIPCRIDWFATQVNSDQRIVKMDLDPRSDRLTLQLNPA